MAGLFESFLSPEVRALVSAESGGLLGRAAPGAWTPRRPDNGLLDQLLGQGPGDPRSDAISELSVGLLRGDVASGFENANRAFARARERDERQRLGQLDFLKTGLELDNMLDKRKRERGIRGDLDKLYQGAPDPASQSQIPQPDAQPLDSFGVPNIGGVPMFSQAGAQDNWTAPPMLAAPQAPQNLPRAGNFGVPPAPAGAPQRGAMGEGLSNRLLQQAQVYARWGDYERADKLYEQAAKWQPEVNQIGVAMRDGKPVQVITYKDGRQQVTDYGPAPKTHWVDRGDSIEAVDEYTMQRRGDPFRKGMTPSDRIAAGNLQVSRDRLALDRDAPQYMQTDSGLIALPKRPGAGPITGREVTGADGQPIRAPLKPIPASANAAIVANAQNLKRAQDALTLIQGGEVGGAKGDKNATGWKGFAPNTVLNIADPEGVETRGAIADLGSMVIHDRSGAAVTAAEFPRLAPFIPRATDDPPTAEKKLKRFVEIYQQEAQALGEIYSRDQGYRPSPVLERSTNPPRAETPGGGAKALPLPANPTASSLRAGQAYTLPNGKTATWDGFAFKVNK